MKYFFKSSFAGKVENTIFPNEKPLVVEDKNDAKRLRKAAFFKKGIVVELTAEEFNAEKKANAKVLGANVIQTTQDEIDAEVNEKVEAALTQHRKETEDAEEALRVETEAIEEAKAYLDANEIKYNPITGLVKLQAKVSEHKASLPN